MSSSHPKVEKVQKRHRKKRFSKALPYTGTQVSIPGDWNDLPSAQLRLHDPVFVEILKRHRLPIESPVPLVGRYSKARPWSAEELDACVKAHRKGISIALMSAALNRNPQDIIYRLLDECAEEEGGFKEVGLKKPHKWNDVNLAAARELFASGLTAWRIAALFGVDFEGAEKVLYRDREDYGHSKKNPFAICTDHKQEVNRAVLSRLTAHRVLDAFAGEGRFVRIIHELFPDARAICVEEDPSTFERGSALVSSPNIHWIQEDNVLTLKQLRTKNKKFDIVDLDPFVSCRDQLDLIWDLLKDESALFVTFGGEYRRSFIRTNRTAIARRYGFLNPTLSNSEYLDRIPAFFVGWVAHAAAEKGFMLDIVAAVRYPNNCRFWTKARLVSPSECREWYTSNVEETEGGYFWKNLKIPRFSEVRYSMESVFNGGRSKSASSKPPRPLSGLQLGLEL